MHWLGFIAISVSNFVFNAPLVCSLTSLTAIVLVALYELIARRSAPQAYIGRGATPAEAIMAAVAEFEKSK
jgi:hypothetical protein